MNTTSNRIDFEFPGLIEQIEDRGDYVAIKTPGLPGFYWGNYLLFPKPPGPEDYDLWGEAFRAEFASLEEVGHEAFGWNSPNGELGNVEPFQEAGFRVSRESVMVANRVIQPPHLNVKVETRIAASDEEWASAEDCIAGYSGNGVSTNKRLTKMLATWQDLTKKEAGGWYNAYLDGRVAGGLGTFQVRDTFVVYEVATHPDFRRRGVARTAVYSTCRQAIENPSVGQLLLNADHGGSAERMYEQIGFRTLELELGLLRPM